MEGLTAWDLNLKIITFDGDYVLVEAKVSPEGDINGKKERKKIWLKITNRKVR